MAAGVVVIGAGQAGLAVSHELALAGVEHVVLERDRVASSWRGRWDSFCLNTPNWAVGLPGSPYSGADPEGFMDREEVVGYIEGYAASNAAPVKTGVEVTELASAPGGFRLRTSAGELPASQVVVASGAYQRPHRPLPYEAFPPGLQVLDADEYRNPSQLPPGRVLILGSGQTGVQLAEDLQLAGREVFVACGRAAWGPRRLDGLDTVTWLARTSWFELPLARLPNPRLRLLGNILLSGFAGGHDLNYRVLQKMGVTLLGHVLAVEGRRVRFAPDLAETVAFSDQLYGQMCKALREELPAAGYEVPELPVPEPFVASPPEELDLDGFGAVIYACGYRPDYDRWVKLPVFDEMGFPITVDGSSPDVPGLHFVGVHFLRKRKSSLLFGVGEDAGVVARSVAAARAG